MVNLVDRSLNLKLTTILAKDFTQALGGKIGGLLTTALSNSRGELVIPALVTGTFSSPRFEFDPGRVAKLPTKDNPGTLMSTIQGVLGQPRTKQPAASDTGKQPGIFDVIDAFRKKK